MIDLDRFVAGGVAVTEEFSGVVAVAAIDGGAGVVERCAIGLADRAHGIPMTVDHRIGVASATKTLTALTALSCIDEELLSPDQPVRSLLGDLLPLVDDRVTVEMLLRHRSGIGDYFDEDDPELDELAYVMQVPVHTLDGADGYLAAIDGYPQKFEPGSAFAYCNSGYVLLAVLIERVTGETFATAVHRRVAEPAGLRATGFERMDSLPASCATGYVEADGLRTNVLHLPVLGFGDGGVFTTVDDVHRLWRAMLDGPLTGSFERMRAAHPDEPRYGMGLWLDATTGEVWMEGMDVGASFRSTWSPSVGRIATVMSNTGSGAWPVDRALRHELFEQPT